ncbi:MAG TPA: hypothetical protein DCZ83_00330 [Candidatus Yonathbacteria bacterium]|nr:hypothetical protein [Candidatus Yonathbacteria bacterium]
MTFDHQLKIPLKDKGDFDVDFLLKKCIMVKVSQWWLTFTKESKMALRVALNETEMGEIALAYVKRKIRQDSIPLNAEKLRRETCNVAKEIGISQEKAMQFVSQILDSAFKEVLVGLSK